MAEPSTARTSTVSQPSSTSQSTLADQFTLRHAETAPQPERRPSGAGKLNTPKKLVVCCDGTWQDRDNKTGTLTNVARLAYAVSKKDDHEHPQIVYYQAGVGTESGVLNKYVGGGTGKGFAAHVRESYAFLAANWASGEAPGVPRTDPDVIEKGDMIYLMGFSRGAYTARSLGALLGAVGLLKKEAMILFQTIYDDYQSSGRATPLFRTEPLRLAKPKPGFFDEYLKNDDNRRSLYAKRIENLKALAVKPGPENIDIYLREYKKLLMELGLTHNVKINCIGVFDTVGALGVPTLKWAQKAFPLLPNFVRPYGWYDTRIDDHVDFGFHALALDEKRAPFQSTLWEKTRNNHSFIKQVWFPGAHSNIGGGFDDAGIADICLTWMMDHLSGNDPDLQEGRYSRPAEYWLKFDENYVKNDYERRKLEHQSQVKKGAVDKVWPSWACGVLNDSYTFPHNLLGSERRTPGRYHRMDYERGRLDKHQLLENTHELIHACVRERLERGGNSVEPAKNALLRTIKAAMGRLMGLITENRSWWLYQPMALGQPLEGWRLDDGHPDHLKPHSDATVINGVKAASWHYEGKAQCNYKTIPMSEDSIQQDSFQAKLRELDYKPQHMDEAIRNTERSGQSWLLKVSKTI